MTELANCSRCSNGERCGTAIVSGHLCANCLSELRSDLVKHEELEQKARFNIMKENEVVYYNFEKKKKCAAVSINLGV